MKRIPDDFGEGDGLSVEDVNEILAAMRELQELVKTSRQELRKAKTPSGGIPANGSANCTVAAWNPYISTWANGSTTLKVWNPSSAAAVAGNTLITAAFVSGRWECILEPC
jgi:hypothetical protein